MSSYPPPYPQPYAAPPQNSNTAVMSLVAGIAGLTIFPFVGSVIAVILGHMSKGEIARSGGALGGEGAATWGLILGYVGIGLTVVGTCIFGALFLVPFCLAFFAMAADVSWLPLLFSV